MAITTKTEAYKLVPLGMLSDGLILASAIFDQERRLLLGAGMPVTKDLVVGLHKRGVRSVVVSDKDYRRLTSFAAQGMARNTLPPHGPVAIAEQTDSTRQLDAAAASLDSCAIEPSDNPFSEQIRSPGAVRYERADMDRVFQHRQQSVDQVENLLTKLEKGETVVADALQNVTRGALVQAAQDLDLFVCMGINPQAGDSTFAHSTNVAMLAVAIGATLGLDEPTLCDLGTGCLVHDAGMLHVDPELFQSSRVLTDEEFVAVAKHSVIATDMLYKNMTRVPVAVRMIVYQMHERCNGSGYPRGCDATKIHPLSKIAMVADAYVGLVSPRPHRPAMLPYFAMAKMLQDVNAGLFDSGVVRALLQTTSLFPIGSYVELSNKMVGKTIRTNGPAYDRPVVEAWPRDKLDDPSLVFDLTESDVRVVKALPFLQ